MTDSLALSLARVCFVGLLLRRRVCGGCVCVCLCLTRMYIDGDGNADDYGDGGRGGGDGMVGTVTGGRH